MDAYVILRFCAKTIGSAYEFSANEFLGIVESEDTAKNLLEYLIEGCLDSPFMKDVVVEADAPNYKGISAKTAHDIPIEIFYSYAKYRIGGHI